MATHSSVLAWRIPRKGEPGGMPSVGWHRVGNNWSDLAAASAVSVKLYLTVVLTCISLMISESHSVVSEYLSEYVSEYLSKYLRPHRLFNLWNSPGQNTGMGTFPISRGSSQPRDQIQVSHIAGRYFTSWATGEAKNTGVGSLSLLQGNFSTQESNQGLLHCRRILYQLSYQGSPVISDVEHLFMCLSASCISLEKCFSDSVFLIGLS